MTAPDRFWAVVDPVMTGVESISGLVGTGVAGTYIEGDAAKAAADYRDQGFNRTRPDRKHEAVEYVRADVADGLLLALAAIVADEWSGLADEVDDDNVFDAPGAAGLIASEQDPSGEYTTRLTAKGRAAVLAALASRAS